MRVYAEIKDQTNKELELAIFKGSNKEQLVSGAIDLYRQAARSREDQLRSERDQAGSSKKQVSSFGRATAYIHLKHRCGRRYHFRVVVNDLIFKLQKYR